MQSQKKQNIDWLLLLSLFGILAFSLVVLYSATTRSNQVGLVTDYTLRQFLWMTLGIFFMVSISQINYRKLGMMSWLFYVVGIIALLLVFVIGKKVSGAYRWISIGGISIQPSEFMKVLTVLSIAWFLDQTQKQGVTFKNFCLTALIAFVPFVLIVKEPDLGTSLVFVPAFVSMIFVAGLPLRYLFGLVTMGLMALPLAWFFLLKDYQKQRIFTFINPYDDQFGAGWPIIQSKIAIGSGQFSGKGWLQGTQTQLDFLPERHTDFIFSVLGEEFGFLGAFVLIFLYFVLISRSLSIADECQDLFGKLFIVGMMSIIAFQMLINIGMTFGLFPVTGLPLPFMSSGGSAMISFLMAMGLVFGVRRRL